MLGACLEVWRFVYSLHLIITHIIVLHMSLFFVIFAYHFKVMRILMNVLIAGKVYLKIKLNVVETNYFYHALLVDKKVI